ncbi:MAG: phospholipase D-like domain-containing protein [Stellaceae bacterium]
MISHGTIASSPDFAPYIGVAAYLLVAITVTGHALLAKRDVRAAMGWIAIAWLSPIIGGILYYLLGINRVTRRAVKFDKFDREPGDASRATAAPLVSPHIAALADISFALTAEPLVADNRIALLRGGDAAYPAMLAAIGAARESVALASYIFRDDQVGRQFIDALIAAQARGVAVRVLLDGFGAGYLRPRAQRHLDAAGVPVALFLHTWVPWRMPMLNMRNHKKLLIVDGAIGFTGGLNIGVENSAGPAGKLGIPHVDDVHVRIDGPAVRQLMETFAWDWGFTTEEVLDGEIWWPRTEPAGPVFVRGIDSGPDEDIDKLEAVLGAALAQVKSRVRIVSPYFLPDQRLQFALAQAALRGVEIDLVLPQRGDHRVMNWAMRAHLRLVTDIPARVYFSPPPFDHAKLMTMDGEWCLVGSSNWDTRSLRLNFEFDLECYDRGLTEEVDAVIDGKIAASRRTSPAELAAAPRWQQLRDAAARLLLPYL